MGMFTDERTARTFPAVLGLGAAVAVLQGVFDYTGGQLTGYKKDATVDEYERKEQLRKDRRRPFQETLDEIGEGRGTLKTQILSKLVANRCLGIYGPGYAERRRQRIKERYGVDVPIDPPS